MLNPTERGFNGRIWDEARRRQWLDTLTDTVAVRSAFGPGEWNRFRIEAIGSSIKTWINGIPIADISDTMTANGFIGLQEHKTNKELLKVRWKNIRIHTNKTPKWFRILLPLILSMLLPKELSKHTFIQSEVLP